MAALLRQMGVCYAAEVCELDPQRRATWSEQPHTSLIDLPPIGRLQQLRPNQGVTQIILWDPYDFFEQWSHALPSLVHASQFSHVLIYFLNKSPQDIAKLRNYEKMKERAGCPILIGRVPSDSLLPRCYHEMWLLGPIATDPQIQSRLAHVSVDLSTHISKQGAFEICEMTTGS